MSFNQNGIVYTITDNGLTLGTENKENSYPNALENRELTGTIAIPRDITNNNAKYKVTRVGNCAFKFTKLTAVHLPNSITSIGYMAFTGSSTIDYITIPASVSSIDFAAFHASSFTSITFEHGSKLKEIPACCFDRSTKIKELIIPQSITHIGDKAFSQWTSESKIFVCSIHDFSSIKSDAISLQVYAPSIYKRRYRKFANFTVSVNNSVCQSIVPTCHINHQSSPMAVISFMTLILICK